MDGRIFPRGAVYWMSFRADVMKNGEVRRMEIRQSTGIRLDPAHPKRAERAAWGVLKERLRQIRQPGWVGPYNEKLTVADILEAYEIARCDQVKAYNTLRNSLSYLREAFGAIRACALQPEQVDTWRQQMKAVGASEGYIDRILKTLRASYRLALRDRKVAFVPRIDMYNPENARQGFVGPEECAAIHLELARIEPAIADLWLVCYHSGRRAGEVQALTWTDIDRERQTATIARSKNRRPWVVVLGGTLWDIIERRHALRGEGDTLCPWVFHVHGRRIDNNLRARVFNTARVAAGYPTRIWHDLRRTAARDLIDSGVDMTTAKTITGHVTNTIFERYAIRAEDNQRKAMERLEDFRAKQERGQIHGQSAVTPLKRS